MRWYKPQGVDVSLRDFGSEYLVYHAGTGETHLIDPFGGAVLQAVISGVETENDIKMILEEGPLPLDMMSSPVEHYLVNFHRIGLIEPL